MHRFAAGRGKVQRMKGEYQHTIDTKGRLFIPAKFRDELGDSFIATKGLDNCLFLYPQREWEALEEKIRALPLSKSRGLQRFFLSSAADLELDSQGRVLLPASLRQFAGLVKDVTIIGVSGRAEIWDTAHWNDYNSEITTEDIAQAMEDIGF